MQNEQALHSDESSLQSWCTFLLPYPCIMKNTTAIIRQSVEMAQPMYETICKALCSAFDISYQEKKRFVTQSDSDDV